MHNCNRTMQCCCSVDRWRLSPPIRYALRLLLRQPQVHTPHQHQHTPQRPQPHLTHLVPFFLLRRATIDLSPLDTSAHLTLHHSSPVLLISDSSSIFTCDSRALAQHVSLADAVASSSRRAAGATAAKHHDAVFTQAVDKLQEICLSASSSSAAPASSSTTVAAPHDQATGSVHSIDPAALLSAWQQQQLEGKSAVTCAMVIKRLVSPSTAASFVIDAASAGNWADVMTCVRGGGVALSHCPNLVADASAAGQTPIMLECLLRCVDVLEADVACVLTYALHSGTPAAFQSLAAYIASAPAASASAATPSTAAAQKKSKGKTTEKASRTEPGSGSAIASGGGDAARKALLHAALRARVSEVCRDKLYSVFFCTDSSF